MRSDFLTALPSVVGIRTEDLLGGEGRHKVSEWASTVGDLPNLLRTAPSSPSCPKKLKINWQYQDLHTPSPSRDWVAIQKLEADICLFYQQQAHYAHIMSDLYYGDVYALPYWEWLNPEGLENDRLEFVQSGCLMIVLAMAWGVLEGSLGHLLPHLEEARARINECKPASSRVAQLRQHLADVLNYLHDRRPGLTPLEEEGGWAGFMDASRWAHQEFVLGYFRNWSDAFTKHPYYRGDAGPNDSRTPN